MNCFFKIMFLVTSFVAKILYIYVKYGMSNYEIKTCLHLTTLEILNVRYLDICTTTTQYIQ